MANTLCVYYQHRLCMDKTALLILSSTIREGKCKASFFKCLLERICYARVLSNRKIWLRFHTKTNIYAFKKSLINHLHSWVSHRKQQLSHSNSTFTHFYVWPNSKSNIDTRSSVNFHFLPVITWERTADEPVYREWMSRLTLGSSLTATGSWLTTEVCISPQRAQISDRLRYPA